MSFLRQQLFGKNRFRQLVVALVVLVLSMGLAMPFIESKAPNARIHNLGDGLWWSIVTVTVGYGDMVPVTPLGRMVASILIVAGTALYLTIFVVVGTTISESHERFQWRRANERLEEMERQLTAMRKSLDFLVGSLPKNKRE